MKKKKEVSFALLLVTLTTIIPAAALYMSFKALFIGLVLSTSFSILGPVGAPNVSVALASSIVLAHHAYSGLAPSTLETETTPSSTLIASLVAALTVFFSALLLRFLLSFFS